ncbi:ubiquitin and WLM domain-containing protein, partial [Striga asiatica]
CGNFLATVVDILTLIGFCEDIVTDERRKAKAYLMLQRNDLGLVWLVKSSLETEFSWAMEQQQQVNSFAVVWRGQKITLEMNPSATFNDFGEKLQELTNVKADTLRLLVPIDITSKMIHPFTKEHSSVRLDSISLLKGKSIIMMGVPEDEVDELLRNAKVDLRIAGFDEEERRLKQRSGHGSYSLQKLPQGNYIFCDFRTLSLPGIELNPPASKALELLHKLASDPGIIAIMNKHRWRVGILTEMAPVGYVGISPKCILGFNQENTTPIPDPIVDSNQNAPEPDPDDRENKKSELPEPFVDSRINSTEPNNINVQIEESGLNNSEEELLMPLNDCHTEDMQTEIDPGQSVLKSQTSEPDPDDPELQIIQDPVTAVYDRLQRAIQSLKYEVIPPDTGRVLQTLFKIICNVIEHPDDVKYRKLRKANPTIQRNIITYKAAVDILTLIGFCEGIVTDERGKAEAYLMLKRNDPGLLWLAKSSLETCIS